jgi:RHS repeat-associated protein
MVCSFTGKERDEETRYGYFGARYMDHELMTMWLSVDPMCDKYPSISPYAYCAWNPVKLVDSDGREWDKPEDEKQVYPYRNIK